MVFLWTELNVYTKYILDYIPQMKVMVIFNSSKHFCWKTVAFQRKTVLTETRYSQDLKTHEQQI